MATLKADRRLYVTADRSEIVEEGDPRGAWLLVAKGRNIGEGDVVKYGLSMRDGRVHYKGVPEAKQATRPENKMAAVPENKAADLPDEEEGDEPEWVLDAPPEDYLKRYPDGPNADLARRILSSRAESGNGDS